MNRKPRTLVINSRCDIRSFVVLHRYWAKQGYGNLNMSQATRLSLDHLADVLVKNDLAKPVTSTMEAVNYIDRIKLSVPAGNRVSLVQQIQKETLMSDGFSPAFPDEPILPEKRTKSQVPKTLIEKARQHLGSSGEVESVAEAVRRRERELEEQKEGLAKTLEKD